MCFFIATHIPAAYLEPMTVFDARDSNQVASVSVIDADLGVGNRRLIVASGIVLLAWRYDSDETWRGEERVLLGIHARDLEQTSAYVGLASIANDESGFVFATDAARVDLNPDNGELELVVKTALMGEWSALNRFAYQVVATVVRVGSSITGKISWPTELYKPAPGDTGAVQTVLSITANKHEMVKGPAFPFERLTPLIQGSIDKLDVGRETCVASYRIPNPPMALPLKVTLTVQPSMSPGNSVAAGRTSGPDVFTLTPNHPSEVVDFAIDRWKGPN